MGIFLLSSDSNIKKEKEIKMIRLVTGLPGSYKSGMSTLQILQWTARNRRWYQKTGVKRPVRSNLRLTDEFTEKINDISGLKVREGIRLTDKKLRWNAEHEFLEYWDDPEELPKLNNCDVVWEEMGAHVDSRSWDQLPHELRRWLQQHRHRGVDIFGNCQDFSDVDIAVRRLTHEVMYLYKIMGSRDPSPTTLPPRFIWGFVAVFFLDARNYNEKERMKGSVFSHVEWISKDVVNLYSMFNDIKPGKLPPLRHVERKCNDCGQVKLVHI